MTGGAQSTKHPGLNLGERHGEANDKAETPVFGFWVFMMSDAVIFGLLFANYLTMRHATAGAPGPHALFDMKSVAAETFLLLTSSLTFGMASLAMKYDIKDEQHARPLVVWLLVTLVLGCCFLALELHDFQSMLLHGGAPQRSGYLSSFWILVPLHGLHVLGASIWMIAILGQISKYGVDGKVKVAVLRLGVLWHFLDVVWVAIFSVVYIGGLA